MLLRLRLAAPLLVTVVICALGVLAPAPVVYAATHIFIEADDFTYSGGGITPVGTFPQYVEVSFSPDMVNGPWYFWYNGQPLTKIVNVFITPTVGGSRFTDAGTGQSFEASHLEFDEFIYSDPPTTPPSGTRRGVWMPLNDALTPTDTTVCSRMAVRHATEYIAACMRLRLDGDEQPGTYVLNITLKGVPLP